MKVTKLSDSEFDRDPEAASAAALNGPLVITENGTPAYVLLSFEHYQALGGAIESDLLRPDQG